jgi:ABC-type nitrate/sulfonate/bicarbonate transport system permease component
MALPFRDHLSRRSELVFGLAGLAILVGVWCALTYGRVVPKLFLPTPTAIWEGLIDYSQKGWLWLSLARSFTRVLKALCLVILVGVPLGILMGAFKRLDALLQKIVGAAKSVPTTAITGVVVLWFGIDETGKTVFLFLGAIFFMIVLVRDAVVAVPGDYVTVALDLGANRRQLVWQVLLPGALPRIWEAIIVCNGIMWTYIVLAEFLSSNAEQLGLGYLLQIGSRTQSPGKVFGIIIIIAAISSLTDLSLQAIRRRYLDW